MSFIDPKQIIIGSKVWMTRNLDIDRFKNNDLIPQVMNDEEWEAAGIEGKPAWCFYGNDPQHAGRHGVLYNSFAVNDPRGIAPEGWRIPMPGDWDELIHCLGGAMSGIKLKSTELWMPQENGASGNGTNESGFNASPGGQRNFIGKFSGINLTGAWWSASDNRDEPNWFYYLSYDSNRMDKGISDPEDGFSLRLVKDHKS